MCVLYVSIHYRYIKLGYICVTTKIKAYNKLFWVLAQINCALYIQNIISYYINNILI